MKSKKILLTTAMSVLSLFAANVYAQTISPGEQHRMDSMQTNYNNEALKSQKEKDATKITDAKTQRRETKAKAKEAKRIEIDARNAAKESKNALKAEQRAQKSRERADKQAQKAVDAKAKSDQN